MKQTAVEWLYEHILLTPLDIRSINKCLEQAKEMEKNQIIEAWNVRAKINGVLTWTDNRDGEQYYSDTYIDNRDTQS